MSPSKSSQSKSRKIFSKTGLQSPDKRSQEKQEIKTVEPEPLKIDMNSDNSRVSHRTGNATFTTITSEESLPQIDEKLTKNKHLQRNRKLW